MRGSLRHRLAALAALIMFLPLLGPASHAEDSEAVSVVAKINQDSPLDRHGSWSPGKAPMVINPGTRRGYRLFTTREEGSSTTAIAIHPFDLDTFQDFPRLRVPTNRSDWQLQNGNGSNTSQLPYAVDEKRGRLFITIAFAGSNTTRIWVLDEDLIAEGSNPLIGELAPPIASTTGIESISEFLLRGLTVYDDREGRSKLLLAYQRQDLSFWTAQWDVERAISKSPTGWTDWEGRVAACGTAFNPPRSQAPLFVTDEALYTACVEPRGNFAGAVLAVKVPLGPAGAPLFGIVEQASRGPSDAVAALADPAAVRLHVVGTRETSHEMWTFDGISGRWVGRSGIKFGPTNPDSFGIDPRSGRVYALTSHQELSGGGLSGGAKVITPGGFMMIEGRMTPVPQPLLFPRFAYPGVVPMQVDPGTADRPARVYVRRGPDHAQNPNAPKEEEHSFQPDYPKAKRVKTPADPFWLVLEDRVPAVHESEASDPDRRTVDLQEQEGLTGSVFDASSGAFAARVRIVGGIPVPAACAPFNRTLSMAWIGRAELNGFAAVAEAQPLAADDITRGDAAAPASRCQPADIGPDGFEAGPISVPRPETKAVYETLDVVGQDWDLPEATCTGTESDAQRYARIPVLLEASAAVDCDDSVIDANAVTRVEIAGVVSIADARTTTRMFRDPQRGVVVQTEARLSGIEVPLGDEFIRIDSIRAIASGWSNGRPHDGARGSYIREICGLHGVGGEDPRCYKDAYTSSCSADVDQSDWRTFCEDEVSAISSALSRVLGTRGRVRAPQPDPRLREGSPGGFVVAIQKAEADRFDDQLLNGDASFEVPAVEIIREDEGRRQILQLAAVRAAATYGIYCLPPRAYAADSQRCVQAAVSGIEPTEAVPRVDGNLGAVENLGRDASGSMSPPNEEMPDPALRGEGRLEGGRSHRVILLRSPGDAILTSAVWFSILLPLMLGARRRIALGQILKGTPS